MERETLAGHYYTVTSKSGCTVTDSTGTLNQTVPAGGQLTVQAPSDKLILSDDEAIVFKVNFRGALITIGGSGGGASNGGDATGWYEVLRFELDALLGSGNYSLEYSWKNDRAVLTCAVPLDLSNEQVLAVERMMRNVAPTTVLAQTKWESGLPMAYTPLTFLESEGSSGFKLPYNFDKNTGLEVTAIMSNTVGIAAVVGLAGSKRISVVYLKTGLTKLTTEEYGSGAEYGGKTAEVSYSGKLSTGRYNWLNDKKLYISNGTNNASVYNDQYIKSDTASYIGIFYYKNPNTGADAFYAGAIYSAKVSQGTEVAMSLLPALDASGQPCFYDTVTDSTYYSNGAAKFVAGISTQSELDRLFFALPDRSGQDVGVLQVRLPDELKTDENEAAAENAARKNWEISFAA